MDVKKKFDLVTRNLQEVIGEDELLEKLSSRKTPVCYLGTAITGVPHVGYFTWALKVSDLLRAGFKVKLLLADLHGALDSTPWELLEHKYKFYAKIIPLLVEAMGADVKNLEFVKGSSFQLSGEYVTDVFKLASITSVNDCHRAASEVVKFGDSPKLSGYLYPLMQALDEQYLGVDAQLGGSDQRKIMVLAREKLPQMGYDKRVELLTPLIPGLVGDKMSSSVEASKISLLDDESTVKKKVNGADFIAGNPDNGVMAFFKHIIFTLKHDAGKSLIISRPEKFGGDLTFDSYDSLEKAVRDSSVHPLDVKMALASEINVLLSGIRKHASALEKLREKAYA